MSKVVLLPSKKLQDIDGLDACPVCHKRKDLNPGMILLVSTCFHRACSECVARIFGSGKEPCPQPLCGRMLRQRDWTLQTFEDLEVEKEVNIRRKLAGTFNKRPDDFETDAAYNDYLEMVEESVFNLISETGVKETWAKIEAFKRENEKQIADNLEKAKKDEERTKWLLEKERKDRLLKKEFWQKKRIEDLKRKTKEHEEFIRELESSGKSSAEILEARRLHQVEMLNLEMEEPEWEEEVFPDDVKPVEQLDTSWPNLVPDASIYKSVKEQFAFVGDGVMNLITRKTLDGLKKDVVSQRYKNSKQNWGYAVSLALQCAYEGLQM